MCVQVRAVVSPECVEVIFSPHDLVENLGRPMAVVFAEAEKILRGLESSCQAGALAILAQLKASAERRPLADDWWARPARRGQWLPRRVLESERSRRLDAIRTAVDCHVDSEQRRRGGSLPARVVIVCHWGVLYTLTGIKGAKPLESVALPAFWAAAWVWAAAFACDGDSVSAERAHPPHLIMRT